MLAVASAGIIVGRRSVYTVRPGDSATGVGARFGLEPATLARQNRLSPVARLRPGQRLEVDNRHIAAGPIEDGILINVPQRLFFYFEEGRLVAWYPVGLGGPDWPTPLGRFHVATKEIEPVWDVPSSIQEEMRRKGKKVETRVPPGPENPLGRRWMGLSPSSCGIHGTNAPASVYHFQTHGCIRLHPDDVLDLFSRVTIGTPVEIVYEPVLLARSEDGAVFLEVHRDVYRRAPDPIEAVKALAAREGLDAAVDWALVGERVRKREGLATDVSARPVPEQR